jgi:EAL domain-containing protein (putative c-di-GMP-specific phosphodiesterase class I)
VTAIVLVTAIGAAPFFVGREILGSFADKVGRAELTSLANRELGRIESALAEAVTTLRDADRAGLGSCNASDIGRLGDTASKSLFIRRIGIVDRDGYAMCFDPPPPVRRGVMLPPAEKSRQVTVSLLDRDVHSERQDVSGTAIVAWRTASGLRLVAEISAAAIDLEGGAGYLWGARGLKIELDGGHVWSAEGAVDTADSEPIVTKVHSEHFPITVTVTSHRRALRRLVEPLEVTLAIGSMACLLVLLGAAVWTFWKPPSEVDDEISVALRRGEFVPYFQPVLNIDTGRIEGCEMLVRWIRADGSMVSPGAFMSYCETSGHVFEMTRQLMRRSAAELGKLYEANRDLKLSINLFAGHFDDRRIVEDVIEIFGGGRISYEQLVFEVTERYPLADIVQARRIIAEMHALGCRVALDDTGTGHGGLAYIQQLGIDIVKIDKMFVDAMGTDLGASTIVDVLVELANSLGMGVVAEGVETQEQLERLRDKGVTSAQGYVFAPALPAKLFIELAENILHPRHPEPQPLPEGEAVEAEDIDAAA